MYVGMCEFIWNKKGSFLKEGNFLMPLFYFLLLLTCTLHARASYVSYVYNANTLRAYTVVSIEKVDSDTVDNTTDKVKATNPYDRFQEEIENRSLGENCDSSTADFEKELSKLDKADPHSIVEARNAFWRHFPPSCPGADLGFKVFRDFHTSVFTSLVDSFYDEDSYSNPLFNRLLKKLEILEWSHDPQILPDLSKTESSVLDSVSEVWPGELERLQALGNAGFVFCMSEGDWYFMIDEGYHSNVVLYGYDIPIKKYLDFQAAEAKRTDVHDAAVIIPWDELRKKLIRYESFVKENNLDSHIVKECNEEMKRLLTLYIVGTSNSPTHNDRDANKKLYDEVRESWEKYVRENTDSKFYEYVRDALEIAKKNNYNYSKEFLDFRKNLSEKGIIIFWWYYWE